MVDVRVVVGGGGGGDRGEEVSEVGRRQVEGGREQVAEVGEQLSWGKAGGLVWMVGSFTCRVGGSLGVGMI